MVKAVVVQCRRQYSRTLLHDDDNGFVIKCHLCHSYHITDLHIGQTAVEVKHLHGFQLCDNVIPYLLLAG